MNKIKWAITDNNISVFINNQMHMVNRNDAMADRLIAALKAGHTHKIPKLVSAAKRVEIYSKGQFVVKNGEILVNGLPVSAVLGNKIMKFSNEGLPYQPLVKFAENLQQNPSFRSTQELFQFLEKNDYPITENGNFIAYKKVRADFKDVHTGTIDNSVGTVVEMPRNQVCEDANKTCSSGLHVANYNYASGFYHGGLMLEVEVNPADVVSVPIDYSNAKMRVCKYKVIKVVEQEHDPNLQLRNISNTSFDETDYFCPDCDDEGCENCSVECEDCGEIASLGNDYCNNCIYDRENDEEPDDDDDDEEIDE